MERKDYFITTAIDYPNAEPHIGTAFEKIGADVQARFQKIAFGRQSYLLMGNDENTQKVDRVAKARGEGTQQYANSMASHFRSTWRLLDINYSTFCQTSDKSHHDYCQAFLAKCFEKGFVYSKDYEGLYCVECEEFKQSVEDGRCPAHAKTLLEHRSERNYFFNWSFFQQELLDLYKTGRLKISPEWRQAEMVTFIQKELKDISISRKNHGWGIPVPWDPSQVIYVWFDALLNYISFAKGHWPADCHVIGKDIVRFHGALFPAMIMAYNTDNPDPLPLPHTIFSHGFVVAKTESGLTKFSKSGMSLGPNGLVDVFGSDAYRYLFMKSSNFSDDCEYSFDLFAELYNADLVNKYGNLFSRVCRLTEQKLDGKLPAASPQKDRIAFQWREHFGNFEYRAALMLALCQIDAANKLLDDKKPWADDATEVGETLAECARVLKTVAFMFAPVMPESSRVVWDSLTYEGDPGLNGVRFRNLTEYLLSPSPLTLDKNRLELGKVPILFPRYKG